MKVKWMLVAMLVIGVGISTYGITQLKPWALSLIKKEITASLKASSVSIKDLMIPLHGPVILTGLVIKKNNAFEIHIPKIVLDKGIWALLDGSAGTIHLEKMAMDQFKIIGVHVGFWWKGSDVIFHILDGKVLKGSLTGDVIVQITKNPSYQAHITLTNVSLPQVVNDFKLKQKFSLTGSLSGKLDISGQGKNFSQINGNLSSVHEGGELTINDTQFIKDMVKRMRLNDVAGSEELFVASLKRYLYNNARVSLKLVQNDLVLNALLEGNAGKREFPIVYHDFNLERLGI